MKLKLMMDGMIKMKKTYSFFAPSFCNKCNKNVQITISNTNLTTKINEIEICYIGNVAYCDICKSFINIKAINDKNIEFARSRYNEGMEKLLKIVKGEGTDENV